MKPVQRLPYDPQSASRSDSNATRLPAVAFSFLNIFVILGAICAIIVIWLTRHILLLLFGGVLLATLLCGLTNIVVHYTRLPRGVALTVVLATLTAIVVFGGWFLGAQFLNQLDELQTGVQKAFEQLQQLPLVVRLGHLLHWDQWKSQPSVAQFFTLVGYLNAGLTAVLAPAVALVAGFFLAIDPGIYRRGFLALIPPVHRPEAEEILRKAGRSLWAWLGARLLSMTVIALTTLIGLWLLGMPMALSLALIAFVTNFIPYIGPASSAIPAVLIALTISPAKAVYVILLYLVIQGIETNLVTPLAVQKSVDLPPVFTLAVQMIFGLLCGLLGVLFATPLSAVAVVLVRELYVENVLHKSVVVPRGITD